MAKEVIYTDEFSGLKRKQEQRPDGAGHKYLLGQWAGWEVYRCNHADCAYDTPYGDAFEVHYYQRHELPEAQQEAMRAASLRERERNERMKENRA